MEAKAFALVCVVVLWRENPPPVGGTTIPVKGGQSPKQKAGSRATR